MQWLAAICVKRPVFATVIVMLVLGRGVLLVLPARVDRFPKVDFPMIVTTVVPGAAPEQVETEVSDRIESAVNTHQRHRRAA
jgi:HAE1 family hydrophobic/amphiphilic exporter-1